MGGYEINSYSKYVGTVPVPLIETFNNESKESGLFAMALSSGCVFARTDQYEEAKRAVQFISVGFVCAGNCTSEVASADQVGSQE